MNREFNKERDCHFLLDIRPAYRRKSVNIALNALIKFHARMSLRRKHKIVQIANKCLI